MKLRHMETTEIKKAPVAEAGPAIPGPRGPALDGGEEAARGNLRSRALPSELAELEAKVAARLAKEAAADVNVLAICTNGNCGDLKWPFKKSWVGSKCIKCNNNPHVGGGVMRLATAAETKSYNDRVTADAVRRDRIAFEECQTERRKIGEIPFENIDSWRAARKADWVGRLKHDAEVAAVWAAQKGKAK